MDALEKQIAFIKEAEGLKSVLREAWTFEGRRESTAEHSWRLALLAGLLAPSFSAELGKTLMMCLVHDLGELYLGDISAVSRPDEEDKHKAEERDVRQVLSLLPERQGEELLTLWREYNENSTPEARLVKALDKAETILQHNQGMNPPDFDYEFNLSYGKQYFAEDPLLLQLRKLLDAETADRLLDRDGIRPYRPEDCEETAALFYETIHQVNAGDYTQEQLDAWAPGLPEPAAWNRSFRKRTAFVAVSRGRIAGFGDIDGDGCLDRLYVHRDEQGKGTASALCDRLEAACPGKSITVHASVTARPFFEKRGYRTVAEETVLREGIELIRFKMVKDSPASSV